MSLHIQPKVIKKDINIPNAELIQNQSDLNLKSHRQAGEKQSFLNIPLGCAYVALIMNGYYYCMNVANSFDYGIAASFFAFVGQLMSWSFDEEREQLLMACHINDFLLQFNDDHDPVVQYNQVHGLAHHKNLAYAPNVSIQGLMSEAILNFTAKPDDDLQFSQNTALAALFSQYAITDDLFDYWESATHKDDTHFAIALANKLKTVKEHLKNWDRSGHLSDNKKQTVFTKIKSSFNVLEQHYKPSLAQNEYNWLSQSILNGKQALQDQVGRLLCPSRSG